MLTKEEKRRLIQLLGMLGSDHEGEMINAARLVRQFVKHHKLQFFDLLSARDGVGLRNGYATTGSAANRADGGVGEGVGSYQEGLEKGQELAKGRLHAEYHRGFADGVKSAHNTRANRTWKQWAKDRIEHDEDCLTDWEITFFGDFWTGRFALPTANQKKIFVKVAARLGIEYPGQHETEPEMPF